MFRKFAIDARKDVTPSTVMEMKTDVTYCFKVGHSAYHSYSLGYALNR